MFVVSVPIPVPRFINDLLLVSLSSSFAHVLLNRFLYKKYFHSIAIM